MLKDNENGQTVQKIILLYLIMPNSPFSDIRIKLTFFISNRFISNLPSDGKLLSNFKGSTLFQ